MQPREAYTAKQITEILGIYPKTLSYWVKKGIIVPAIWNPSGRGTTRLFSPYNVYETALVRELAKDELPLASIRRILDVLEQRQFFRDFESRFEEGLSEENHLYLIWARDYTGDDADLIEINEIRVPEDWGNLHIHFWERVLVFNLTMLCVRIFAELDGAGVWL